MRTLAQQVVGLLRTDLINGVFAPGEYLNEGQLAADYGISRGSLREALRLLEHQGLLSRVTHRGVFVREFSPSDIESIFRVRFALETEAARRAAGRLTDHTREALEKRLLDIGSAEESSASPERVRADFAFHEAICDASGNHILADVWGSLTGPIMAAMITAGPELLGPLQTVAFHRPLLEAIYSKDEREIGVAFESHFAQSAAAMTPLVSHENRSS